MIQVFQHLLYVIFVLNLNDTEFALLSLGIILWHCHNVPDVFEQSMLYSIRLYFGTTIPRYTALST